MVSHFVENVNNVETNFQSHYRLIANTKSGVSRRHHCCKGDCRLRTEINILCFVSGAGAMGENMSYILILHVH